MPFKQRKDNCSTFCLHNKIAHHKTFCDWLEALFIFAYSSAISVSQFRNYILCSPSVEQQLYSPTSNISTSTQPAVKKLHTDKIITWKWKHWDRDKRYTHMTHAWQPQCNTEVLAWSKFSCYTQIWYLHNMKLQKHDTSRLLLWYDTILRYFMSNKTETSYKMTFQLHIFKNKLFTKEQEEK